MVPTNCSGPISGFPPRTAPDGREVGAVYGLLNTTLSLLRDPDLTHIAAATDTVIESFRNDLYHGYKTGVGVPEDLMAQFGLAEQAFRTLGVAVWGMTDFESGRRHGHRGQSFRVPGGPGDPGQP